MSDGTELLRLQAENVLLKQRLLALLQQAVAEPAPVDNGFERTHDAFGRLNDTWRTSGTERPRVRIDLTGRTAAIEPAPKSGEWISPEEQRRAWTEERYQRDRANAKSWEDLSPSQRLGGF